MRPFSVNIQAIRALSKGDMDIEKKVALSLIEFVFEQTFLGMATSTLCALVIFIGLYNSGKNPELFIWIALLLSITILRIVLASFYSVYKKNITAESWGKLYTWGALLAGVCWGLTAFLFLPYILPKQQVLLVLMLAGVTAGAVPLSAGIPAAAIAFLICMVVPYIIVIYSLNNYIYFLFDLALTLYLTYMIILSIKTYNLVKNAITLQFENDLLLSYLEMSNQKLERAATHDPLTHIANRRLFILTLEKALEQARESKSLLALLYLDLDHFKLANDMYGHQIGDHILIATVERLKNYFRSDEIIARLGGDEIAIILTHIHNRDDLEQIARDICKIIAVPIEQKNIRTQVTASIGIAIFPYDGQHEDSLIRQADASMYQAKKNGGNTYRFSRELREMA